MKYKSLVFGVSLVLIVFVLLVITGVIRIPGNTTASDKTVTSLQDNVTPSDSPSTSLTANIKCFSKEEVQKAIADANYCTDDKDCISIFFGCPFGCSGYINKNALIAGLEERILIYKKCTGDECADKCDPAPQPVCVNNKCVEKNG